jgi:hypothetical protein
MSHPMKRVIPDSCHVIPGHCLSFRAHCVSSRSHCLSSRTRSGIQSLPRQWVVCNTLDSGIRRNDSWFPE